MSTRSAPRFVARLAGDDAAPGGVAAVVASTFLLGAAVVVYLVWSGRLPICDDFGDWHLPVRKFYAEALDRGTAYDWMPTVYNGYNVTGEGQAGTYHPAHQVLYRLLPFHAAFWIETTAHYPLAALGAFLWLRRFVRTEAAVFGAAALVFNGYFLLHFMHMNFLAVFAHVPWALWGIELSLSSATRRRGVAVLAVVTASQLLHGHPQMLIFSLFAELPYTLLRWAQLGGFSGAAAVVAGKLLGVGLGAVQLLATLGYMHETSRDQAQIFSPMFLSLPPLEVLKLVNPYSFDGEGAGRFDRYGHETGIYCGMVPTVLLVVGAVGLGQRLRQVGWRGLDAGERIVAAAMGAVVVCLLLMLGEHGVLYPLLVKLPVLGRMRCPVRFIGLAQLSLAFIVAWVVDRLMRRTLTPSRAALVGAGLVPLSSMAAALYLPGSVTNASTAIPVMIGAAAVLLVAAAYRDRRFIAALVLLMIGDQAWYAFGLPFWKQMKTEDEWRAMLPLPPDADGLVFDQESNRMAFFGFRLLNGYGALPPRFLLPYGDRNAQRAAGVRWIFAPIEWATQTPGRAQVDPNWFVADDGLPRVRLVNRAALSADPGTDIFKIDVARQVLVDVPVELDDGAVGRTRLVVDEPGRLVVDVECTGRSLLVLSDRGERGWRVEVDGVERQLVAANGDFLACPVHTGDRTVQFLFQPTELVVGKMISVVTAALFLCAVVVAAGVSVLSSRRHGETTVVER